MKAALLIIDMQVALVAELWRGDQVTRRIARLAERARTQGAPVIALQQTGPAGSAFDPNADGWQLDRRLGLRDSDVRLCKTATDSFFGTDLAQRLIAYDVDTVVITGAATDYCVDATARSALSHRFDVVLVEGAHTPTAHGLGELTAEQVIAHHNRILSQAVHPGGTLCVVAAHEVFNDS